MASRRSRIAGLTLGVAAATLCVAHAYTSTPDSPVAQAASAALGGLQRLLRDPAPVADPQQREELAYVLSVARAPRQPRLQAAVQWKNGLAQYVLPLPLPAAWVAQLPLCVQSWWANCVLCYVEYFATAALWALWIYRWYPNSQVAGKHPSREAMWAQVGVSCRAIPLYTLLPPLSEHLILSGYTRVYGRLSSVSPAQYCAQVAAYMLCVEFGVYWMHRKLHEVKWAYSWLHRVHHVYNKEHTLSPFAGLAFHPLDGLLQAVPYVWSLFLVPTHYFTHEVLLFATGLWTANIHDCIHGRCEPIMGAAYHAIHHTTYKHNYGHYTTLFDGLFGTLERPKLAASPAEEQVKAGKAQ